MSAFRVPPRDGDAPRETRPVTARDAVAMIAMMNLPPVTQAAIRKWAERGKVRKYGLDQSRRQKYELHDIVRMAGEAQAEIMAGATIGTVISREVVRVEAADPLIGIPKELPTWAEAPPFDAALGVLPIVCTGGIADGPAHRAQPHPAEMIGVYFKDPNSSVDWLYRGRPVHNGEGVRLATYYVNATSADLVAWSESRGVRRESRNTPDGWVTVTTACDPASEGRGTETGGRGSVDAWCPACPIVHRVSREDWGRYLSACRELQMPWVDVSALP